MTDCFVIVACDRWCSLFGLVSSIEYSILDNFGALLQPDTPIPFFDFVQLPDN